jgi:hypothetical protein
LHRAQRYGKGRCKRRGLAHNRSVVTMPVEMAFGDFHACIR